MVRGFISGIIWGAIISAIVAAAASLFAPLPGRDAIRSGAEVPAVTTPPEGAPVAAPEPAPTAPAPAATPEPAPADEPQPTTPAVSDDTTPGADTASAPQPETGAVEAELQAPATGDAGGVSVQSEAPVQPQTGVTAPQAPVDEGDLSISASPVQPALPSGGDTGPAFGADTAAEETTGDAVNEDVAALPQATPEPDDISPAAEAPEVDDTAPAGLPSVRGDGDTGADEGELTPQIGRPAGSLNESFPQLQSSRLPSVGDAEGGAAPVLAEAGTLRPLDTFAVPFTNPDSKPLMAIVLIDTGDGGMDADVLTGFPYPLTFAIDTLMPGAAEKMATYRAKGFEVLAMIDLPKVATATDVEVAMPAHLAAVPEAVAVLEGQKDGLQGNREVSSQVTQILRASGHGLVMLPNGLNTVQKLAARDGVPSASVFRDFDGKGQNAAAIRRFLDQAAFKAAQEGGVIMLGRLQPETVSALLLWALADRAESVALAPVSALLSGQ